MKKGLIALFSLFIVFSCSDEEFIFPGNSISLNTSETDFEFSKTCEDDLTTIPIGINKIGKALTTPINYSIEVLDASTAEPGVHYNLSSTTGTIPAGEYLSNVELTVNSNLYAAGEEQTIILTINTTDVEFLSKDTVEYTLAAVCQNDFEGDMNFVQTDLNGDETSGTVSFTFDPLISGYKISDPSYGIYTPLTGMPPTGTIKLENDCCTIALSGTDNETSGKWSITEVSESGGPNLTYSWINENSFMNVGGTVTLTRVDGASWPLLSI